MVVYFSLKIKLGIIGFQIWFLFLVYKRLSLLYTESWNIIRTDTNVFSSLYYNLQHNNYLNQKHVLFWYMHSVQFSSVTQCVWLFASPWIAARQASLSIINSQSSLKFMSIELMMQSSHLILCHPLLLLPSIPPSIRVFSNESTLRMRWTKYWSFSFSISASNEHPGLISFKIDWLNLLQSKDSQESSPTPQFKSIDCSALSFLHSPTLTSIHDHWKNHSLD